MGMKVTGPDSRRLKLAKRTGFVKYKIKYLPQKDHIWEADIQELPRPNLDPHFKWFGMVICRTDDWVVGYQLFCVEPTVYELAGLLANSLRGPLFGLAYRPTQLHLRENTNWAPLVPHLADVGIEVTWQEALSRWNQLAMAVQ